MGIAPAAGAEFFPLLVHHLARALDVSCALIGELRNADDKKIASLTANLHGKLSGNFEYPLHGSPFEEIGDGEILSYSRGIRARFPADQLLTEMKFESCTATPLQDSEGRIVGIMAVMDEHAQTDPDLVSEVLRFLAPRVGAEFERKRHEEALRFTQFSIDRSGDASFWMGPDGRFTYVNDAACRSLGYMREELLTMCVPDIDAIHDAEKWPDTWERIRAGSSFTFESVHRRKDGSTFPVEITVNYLEFAGREYNCAFARNITERKRVESFSRGQNQVLETIAKGASLIATLDALTRFIEKQSPDAACFVCLVDEGGETISHVASPSLPESFTAPLVRLPIKDGGGACGAAVRKKSLVVVADCETDPICGGFRDHILSHGLRSCWSSPIFSSSGEILGTFALFYRDKRRPADVELQLIETASQLAGIAIERKQDEEALRRSSERFRRLIEHMPEGMVVHRFGPIIYANLKAASMLGYGKPEDLVGVSVLDLVEPALRRAAEHQVRTIRETRKPMPAREIHIRRRDGQLTIAEMEEIPIDFDGEPMVLTIARDLTERKRMQARLLQADRMASVGTLAAGVAHEINNPLAYVISNIDYLAKELPEMVKAITQDPEPGRLSPKGGENGGTRKDVSERLDDIEETLQEAREGAERVRQIVRDLRTFSRDGDEERGPVDAERVLESSINMAGGEIRKRAKLVRNFASVPLVHASESRLGQVFLNLLMNAVQALPEGRIEENEIQVRTSCAGEGRVLVEVRDTGEGIPPENLDRIFQPFFTTKPVGIGTGLGLSICQNIITSLGGEISVTSEVGQYTSFRILLPVSPENGKTGAKRS